MKAKKLFILSAIICVAIVTIKCKGGASDANKMLAQKWQCESMTSKAMDDQMAALKTQADTTKDSTAKAMLAQNVQMMNGMMEAMKSTTMDFKADGIFENSMSMMGKTDTKKGKWSVSADGKKLYTSEMKSDNTEKTDTIAIGSLDNDKLTLIVPDGKGGEMTITMKAIK